DLEHRVCPEEGRKQESQLRVGDLKFALEQWRRYRQIAAVNVVDKDGARKQDQHDCERAGEPGPYRDCRGGHRDEPFCHNEKKDNAGMATLGFIEYAQASAEVRAVYDDIMATRQTDWINNFWKAIANDPKTLRRTWESAKQIM